MKNLKTETGVTIGTICHNTTPGRNIFGKKEAHCFEKNAEIVTITNSAVLAQSHYTKQKKTAVRRRQAFCMVLTAVEFIPSSQALSSVLLR